MPNELDYGRICCGEPQLEYLRFDVDFAWWLCEKFDGRPETTIVSLVTEPQAALDAEITKLLADRREEFFPYLECPKCGASYNADFDDVCESSVLPKKQKSRRRRTPFVRCGAALVPKHRTDVSKKQLREEAGFFLARAGNVPSRINTVCRWLVNKMGCPPPTGEVCQPLGEVFDSLLRLIDEHFDRFESQLPEHELYLEGRRNLIPKGATLREKYEDYIDVRGRIRSAYVRLWGVAQDNPECIAWGEDKAGPRSFPHLLPRPGQGAESQVVESDGAVTAEEQARLDKIPERVPGGDHWLNQHNAARELIRRAGGDENDTPKIDRKVNALRVARPRGLHTIRMEKGIDNANNTWRYDPHNSDLFWYFMPPPVDE